ncbi:MAG: hypothetical protein K8T20_13655 [Planctomycetes bacterium]|nr:hypothetical protein [Planctomycetota bacterium]
MLKGLLLGAVLGAAIAAGAYRGLMKHREASPPTVPGEGGPGVATPVAASNPDLYAAKAENARLAGELAAIRKTPAPGDPVPVKPVPVATTAQRWKALGAKIYKMRDQLKNHDGMSPETSEIMSEFMALLGEASRRDGVTIDEVILSPDGMLGMLVGILEGSDLPPDAAQQAKVDAVLAKTEKAWKDYLAGRGDRAAMEGQRDLLKLAGGGYRDLQASMTPAQYEMMEKLEMFKGVPSMGMNMSLGGPRETVASQLTDRWKNDLQLDDTQAISIRPVVDEYMRRYDELQAESARRKAAGEKPDEWADAIAEADLMVAAQKSIQTTLRLTDKQAEAVKGWKGRYDYTVSEGK